MTPVLIVSSKTGGSKSINLAHSHTVNSHTHTTKDHTLTIAEMPSHNHAGACIMQPTEIK